MIELKQEPNSNVIIVTAHGKISDDDYEDKIIPAVNAKHEQFDKLRLLYVLGADYDGFKGAAMWDDTKVGVEHFTHFEKIGIVSDKKSIRRAIKAFGFLIPAEVKIFANDQLAEAESWIAA